MNLPFVLPAVFDASVSPEEADGSLPRLPEAEKAGAEAVCVSLSPTGKAEFSAVGNLPVGGMLGPSGISLESPGEHDFDYLYALCREKVAAFADSGASFLLLNRQTSLADLRAALLASKSKKLPVLACLTAGQDTDQGSFLPALITLQAMGASAVGLCGLPNDSMLDAVRHAMHHTSVPLFVVADALPSQTPAEYADAVHPLLEAGIRLVGCDRNTTAEHLRFLAEGIKKFGPPEIPEEPDCYAAATEQEAFFLGDNIEFSKPLTCSDSLVDKLIDLEDERVTAALVHVESIDDAVLLGKYASMSKLPIAVHADSATILDAALRYFQGRLLVDSSSCIEPEVLEPLASKYGAIVY